MNSLVKDEILSKNYLSEMCINYCQEDRDGGRTRGKSLKYYSLTSVSSLCLKLDFQGSDKIHKNLRIK